MTHQTCLTDSMNAACCQCSLGHILAQDDKFMKATDDAYKKFEYT